MHNSTYISQNLKIVFAAFMSVQLVISTAWAETMTIPANTLIYVETDQPVSGKKKRTQVGQVVRASVWRDVIVDGAIVIDAGSSVLVRVDTLKGGRIAGRKGKMTLGAYDTTLIDGTMIDLGGGYFKEGKGRIALSATLAAVVFLPLIFLKGSSADLPRGTVFDAYTKRRIDVDITPTEKPSRSLNLTGVLPPALEVEVLYDELEATEKPKNFAFSIKSPAGTTGEFTIDVVNGTSIEDELVVEVQQIGQEENLDHWRGEVSIKKLGKEFKKGINTFEVAAVVDDERIASEVTLDVQF